MTKTKLLFELIMYVNTKRHFTAQDIAYEFNISVRTAHRYLMELSDLGVPLYTEQGRNGGYRILKNRILPPVIFDENEAFAIFFAFQSLKYYKSLPFDVNIDSASRKLYISLPDDTKYKVDRLESVLSFCNQKRSVSSPFLTEIIEASVENHILIIEYVSKSENKVKKVKPLGVYANNGLWYMPAFDLGNKAIRLFRVDRILSLENSKTIHDVSVSLADWINNHTIKIPIRLYVKLTREGLRQCRSESWLEPHIVLSSPDNGYIDTKIDISEIEFVSNYFFQLGVNANVIEPKEIVENIKQRALNILNHYK
ncbi:YafY family protein [Clostridium sp. YIM B02551]|uniref:helix-turn-helix transcriptional regulator n=1 Tax=Clostridium sp. YIM B02551 TaxID=2910679 RepID=UPI001EEA2ED5|nr:YafY family protein [Clostridium sp. YIM B02551]